MVKPLLQKEELLEYRTQTQTHNQPNWSGGSYFQMPPKKF